MFSIKQTSLLFTGAVAAAVAVGSLFAIRHEVGQMSSSHQTGAAIRAISMLNAATIEMSLERSLMQVGLALPGPFPDRFRAMLHEQREKSNVVFSKLSDFLATADLPNKETFAGDLQRKRELVAGLRRSIDSDLAKSAAERTGKGPALIKDFKAAIAESADIAGHIRPDPSVMPSLMLTQDLLMQRSWLIREYGGRERTLFAIAIALGKPLTPAELAEMHESNGRALQSWNLIERTKRGSLDGRVAAAINALSKEYFTSYNALRRSLLDASPSGRYPIDFEAFFQQSSVALQAATDLGAAAGEANVQLAYAIEAHAKWALVIIVVLSILALAGTALIVRYFLISVVGRIARITKAMQDLASGQLDVPVESLTGKDEVGDMAAALLVFRDGATEKAALEAEALRRQQRDEKRQAELERHTNEFIEGVQRAMSQLGDQTQNLSRASTALASASTTATESASSARSASETASQSATTVAAAARQLNASVREISEQTMKSREFVDNVADSARVSTEEMAALASAVQEIGSIVALIQGVAQQTNLLALNATIEAARAGEAGRGFAVVASEVKSLAAQTAQATTQIESQIGAIQQKTDKSVQAIQIITTKLDQMNALTESVAAAVMQQEAATNEITRTIEYAAEGSTTASAATTVVTESARQTSLEAERLTGVADSVATLSMDVERAVQSFVQLVRGDINERRSHARTKTSGQIRITHRSKNLNGMLRDMSAEGFSLEPTLPLAVGDVVAFQGDSQSGDARVIWVGAQGIGFRIIARSRLPRAA